MSTIQGPVICHLVAHAKETGPYAPVFRNPQATTSLAGAGGTLLSACKRGLRVKPRSKARHHQRSSLRTNRAASVVVRCSFSSSSDGSGSMAENFHDNDEEYVNSRVIEAVEVRSGSDGFIIKMRDGQHLRCTHNNPLNGHLPDYAPHPAIVLKMEDGSDLLLPIIVLELPSILLMAAMRNIQIARPTVYHVIQEMIDKMGYKVQLVRVTKRVHEAYFARLYLSKVGGDDSETVSFDLRPSDAINIAVRCQVPIQVNRQLVINDGMRIAEPSKQLVHSTLSDGLLFTELDRPDGQPCVEATEFTLVRNMLVAAVEERYRDAAQWRDKLQELRTKKSNWA